MNCVLVTLATAKQQVLANAIILALAIVTVIHVIVIKTIAIVTQVNVVNYYHLNTCQVSKT